MTVEPGQRWSRIDTSGETQRLVVGVPEFYPYAGTHVCFLQSRISGSGWVSPSSDVQIVSLEWWRKWAKDAKQVNQSTAADAFPRPQNVGGRLELAPQKSTPR